MKYLVLLLLMFAASARAFVMPTDEMPSMTGKELQAFFDIVYESAGSDCIYLTHIYVQYGDVGQGYRITCANRRRDELAFDMFRTKRIGNMLTWTATKATE